MAASLMSRDFRYKANQVRYKVDFWQGTKSTYQTEMKGADIQSVLCRNGTKWISTV